MKIIYVTLDFCVDKRNCCIWHLKTLNGTKRTMFTASKICRNFSSRLLLLYIVLLAVFVMCSKMADTVNLITILKLTILTYLL